MRLSGAGGVYGSEQRRDAFGLTIAAGLATGLGSAIAFFAKRSNLTLEDPAVGGAIAIAIALHNIPEGVSVAVPIFYATGRRRAAFGWSLLSGLAEPLGAAIGFLPLMKR